MNHYLIMGVLMVLGFTIGLALGYFSMQHYIGSYTDLCIGQLKKCADMIDRQDPLFKYNNNSFNMTLQYVPNVK